MLLHLLLLALPATAGSDLDRPRAPYLEVDTPNALALTETRGDITIAGVIAHVRITQTYENSTDHPIEATYVFPGSTSAAVFALRMISNHQITRAQIHRREDAQTLYTTAKQAGKTAGLLDQQRPNIFQMRLANIPPQARIDLELDYTELLTPENGIYTLIYPSAISPRYATTQEEWLTNPYATGETKPPTWDLSIHLETATPIRELTSSTHRIQTIFHTKTEADVVLDETDRTPNRDFVLRYRLTGDRITSGLLLSPPDARGDQYFLLQIQPPRAIAAADIPPREYIFLLDVSGSMSGWPLDVAKTLMSNLLRQLTPKDSFNVMHFSGGSAVLSPESLPATRENLARALAATEAAGAEGVTELLPAMRTALALPRANLETARTFIVITDGFVTVEPEIFDAIKSNLTHANLFTFGVGSTVNRHLIEGMARAGMGEPTIVLDRREADRKSENFTRRVATPLLTQIHLELEDFAGFDIEPKTIPDLFSERPITVFGKYRGEPNGRLRIRGRTAAGTFVEELDATRERRSAKNGALRYLWARHRIASLVDADLVAHDDARMKAVERLGLDYELLTPVTSFLAVDEAGHALATGPGWAAPGDATPAGASASPAFTKKTRIDFSDVMINGQLLEPEGAYVLNRKKSSFPSLLEQRALHTNETHDEAPAEDAAPETAAAPRRVYRPLEKSNLVLKDDDGDEVTAIESTRMAWRYVRILDLTTQGALPNASVRAVVDRLRPELLDCRDRASPQRATATLELLIGPDGKVRAVRLFDTNLDLSARKYIAAAILRWVFPEDADGRSTTARVRFEVSLAATPTP